MVVNAERYPDLESKKSISQIEASLAEEKTVLEQLLSARFNVVKMLEAQKKYNQLGALSHQEKIEFDRLTGDTEWETRDWQGRLDRINKYLIPPVIARIESYQLELKNLKEDISSAPPASVSSTKSQVVGSMVATLRDAIAKQSPRGSKPHQLQS